ncbi:MAG: hypothetical protein ACK5IH_15375, partial [Betaproteobacteria bacterium]
MSPDDWFAARGWQPFGFQREVWAAMHAGRSGLRAPAQQRADPHRQRLAAAGGGVQQAGRTSRWKPKGCQPREANQSSGDRAMRRPSAR